MSSKYPFHSIVKHRLHVCRKLNIENINDENVGRQLMIEKHLEHQMLLKKQVTKLSSSPSLLDKKDESSQTLERDTFSSDIFSTTFRHKG